MAKFGDQHQQRNTIARTAETRTGTLGLRKVKAYNINK